MHYRLSINPVTCAYEYFTVHSGERARCGSGTRLPFALVGTAHALRYRTVRRTIYSSNAATQALRWCALHSLSYERLSHRSGA